MPTFVDRNFVNENPVSGDLIIDCPLPPGLVDGDRLLGFCLYGESASGELLVPPASGWTAADASNDNSSSQVSLIWTQYVAGTTPAPSWTLTDVDSTASGLNKAVAAVVAYRSSADPIFGTAAEGTGTSATASGLTTTRNNSTVVAIYSGKVSSITAITGPAGFTQRVSQTIGGGGGVAIWMGDQDYPTAATATGSKVATESSASALWYARLVEFPAPVAVPSASVLRWNGPTQTFVAQTVTRG